LQLIGPAHADHAHETRRFEAMPRRHQRSIPEVKISNARGGATATLTVTLT
jgi:hypothetical protein